MASGQPPFFYHILMNPSSPHLPLPLKFVKKHLRNKILKNPILKSANGGYLWKLKMKKFDDHTFCFVNGWCNVVKDVGLSFGEFLLFKYVGSSVFLMHVYSVNGCEKILAPRINNNFKVVDEEVSVFEEDEVVFDDNDDVEDDDDNDDDDDEVEDEEEEDDDYNDVEEEDEDEEDDDDVEVELGDDAMDEDDGEDEEEDDVDIDGDDGDPFFVITSSKRNKNRLRFPPDLVAMAKIKTKETITIKNDDGHEKVMSVRSYKQNKSTRYYVAEGWKEFQRSNNISEGDECVFKFITSEDKLCLAKVTKKKSRPTEVDNDDMADDDGIDEEGEAEDAKEDDSNFDEDDIFDDEGKGENAKLVNDDENDEDEDDDRDVNGDGGDPSFTSTSSDKNQYMLYFPADFVALAGIDTKKTITLKNLDGYEKKFHVLSYSGKSDRQNQGTRYYLSAGWKEFQRNSNILEGDNFECKFITSEDKFCVTKITKEKSPARPLPPPAEARVTEVGDGMDNDAGIYEEGEAEDAKEDDSNVDGDDVNDDEEDKDNDCDVDGNDGDSSFKDMDDNDVMDADEDDNDSSFVSTITPTYNHTLRMPQLPVAEAQEKEFNGEVMEDDNDKDENEDIEPVADADPSFVVDITTNHKCMLRLPPDFVELAGIDGKKDIIIKCLDGNEKKMVLRPVKQGHLTWYCLSMGWPAFMRSNKISEGDECVFKYITSEDKMSLAKITKKITPPTEVDDNDLNVVVNDNNEEDENVEPVDDGMDGKDVVVDDNKEQDENVKPVDDGMNGKDVVVDNNKDEDETVEPVDDGMDSNDVVVDDNKDEDKDVEFVVTITPGHKSKLRLPIDFVASAGIESKENITMKSLDGNETQMSIRTEKQRHRSTRHRSTQYHLSVGWTAFKQSNNILEGDECVFRYTTSENKMCLAKLTKKENVDVHDNTDKNENLELLENGMDVNDVELVDGMDDKDVDEYAKLVDGMDDKDMEFDNNTNEDENENVELVDDGMDGKDVAEYIKLVDGMDDKDVNEDAELNDEDPFFRVTITPSNKSMLRPPVHFVGLAGINTKKNIIMKSLDGNGTRMSIRMYKQRHHSTQYYLSVGWPAFMRSNSISEGDECVFKYIRSEDKLCLDKVTHKKTPIRLPSPAEVVKRKRGRLPPAAKTKMTPAENVKMRSRRPPPVEVTVAEAVKRKRGQPPPTSPRVAKDVKRKKGRASV